jgi:hypothetical protein
MTYPYKVHDDNYDGIDDDVNDDDLYAIVFSAVFVFSLFSPSPSRLKVD